MKRYLYIGIVFLFLIGCASVPKESVQVSKIIGDGIAENERAHTSLVNKYFELKSEQIDMWVVRVYFPKLIDNIKVELNKSNMSTLLTENQYEEIVTVVIEKRDDMQKDLEKTRVKVVGEIQENYTELIRANSDLTRLLQASSDLKEATEQQLKKVGVEFDFDEFDKSFSKYLNQADKATSQGEKLYDNAKKYIK